MGWCASKGTRGDVISTVTRAAIVLLVAISACAAAWGGRPVQDRGRGGGRGGGGGGVGAGLL